MIATMSESLRPRRHGGVFVALALLLATSVAGCGVLDEGLEVTPEPPGENVSTIAYSSDDACRIDSDCAAGTFCFQRVCVWQCESDADCSEEETCSTRSRCVDSSPSSTPSSTEDVRQQGSAQSLPARDPALELGGVEVVRWPDVRQIVPADLPVIEVELETAAPIPGGEFLYTLRGFSELGTLQSRRASSEGTVFTLQIPTGPAANPDNDEAVAVELVTPFGVRTLYLVSAPERSGIYTGSFTSATFGGSALPLEFVIETIPPDVSSLAEASAASLAFSTSSAQLIGLPLVDDASYVRRPLEYDDTIDAWVAIFAADLNDEALVGEAAFPDVNRAIRVEVASESGEELRGSIADRWRGIFDRTSPDGVVSAATATISGRFTVDRLDDVPPPSAFADLPLDLGAPELRALPALDQCDGAMLTAFRAAAPEVAAACDGFIDFAAFARATPARQADCAVAFTDYALSTGTISGLLLSYLDPEQETPSDQSFTEFVASCAAGAGGLCSPNPTQICARQAAAYASANADSSVLNAGALSSAYDRANREVFLARQLVAFYVDTENRLQWLQSGEAPPFLAGPLQDYNRQILNTYRDEVLETHLDAVFGQLDDAGLAVLARAQTDPDAQATRQTLLFDLINSWRAAMDSLSLLAARWDVLYQNDTQRAEATRFVRQTFFRLYISAGILQELSREAGASYMGGAFGAGFVTLIRELSDLSLPFNDLLFARDAEVVTSQSVDPQSTNASLLAELEGDARAAIADASASVTLALQEEQAASVRESFLVTRYTDQVVGLRNELINLCGLPEGCTGGEVGQVAACAVRTEPGACGLRAQRATSELQLPTTLSDASVSEAGRALFELQEAVLARQAAEESLQALVQQSRILGDTAEAFAASVRDWDRRRRTVDSEVQRLLDEADAIEGAFIEAELAALREDQRVREAAYDAQADRIERWNTIRVDGAEADIRQLGAINALNTTASALELSADRVEELADIFAKAQPKTVGTTTDPSFIQRLGIRFPAFIASTAALTVAEVLSGVAGGLSVDLEAQQLMRDAELSNLEDLAELAELATEDELAAIEANLSEVTIRNDAEQATIEALIEALNRRLEVELAYERDLQELRDRRDRWRTTLVDVLRREYEVSQAELTTRQRELAYYEVVQRAQLIEGRFLSMQERASDLRNLLGSPDVLFSSANRIALAESRLERARRAVQDWLTALEYYAVRPFVSQRLAVLLARNPGQLEAIANELSRLQQVCGGPTTLETIDVSLRDDILQMGFTAVDADTQLPRRSGERFRDLLTRAETPVERQTRLSSDETIGARLDRGNVLAVNFEISAESFANLELTCNAKLSSVAVQLVGDGLGPDAGTAQPVVTMVYGGSGEMRSCQPGIAEYVQQFGPGATAFGPVSAFRTPSRAVSPIAGVGTYGPAQTWNATLEGLPFASDYTVLIDLEHPSNEEINWEALEDIRLQLRYTYQDVFPEGQCE